MSQASWLRRLLGHRGAIAMLIVAVVLLIGTAHIRSRLSAAPKLRTVEMKRGDLRVFIAATGTVEPAEVVEVGALVSGTVIGFGNGRSAADAKHELPADAHAQHVPVRVGTRVVKGGVLAQVDPQHYEIALEQARSAERLAIAEIERLQTRLQQSAREFQRAELLRGTNSESQYDQIASAHAIAEADLKIALARADQAAGAIRQAEMNLARTTIRSPIDGVAIDHRVNLGQNVSPSSPSLFLITHSLGDMRVRTSVSETDIGKVYPGQPVSFTVDGYREQELTGKVEQVLMNARVQGNFVTYDVLVKIDPHEVELLPHMTADVQLETVNRSNAWLVPSESLQWRPDSDVVDAQGIAVPPTTEQDETEAVIWVANSDGRAKPMRVKVGVDDGVRTEIMAEECRESMPVVVGTIRETTLARIIPSVRTLR